MKTATLTRFIPADSIPQTFDVLSAVVYVYHNVKGLAAIGYHGKSSKPDFHYRFADGARCNAYVEKWLDGLRSWENRKAARKQANQDFINPLKIGDIIYNSWGYDQTNVDFYEVVKSTEKTVSLRQLHQHINENGFMCGNTIPCPGQYKNAEITVHHVKPMGSRFYINFEFGAGLLWDGSPMSCSWYA